MICFLYYPCLLKIRDHLSRGGGGILPVPGFNLPCFHVVAEQFTALCACLAKAHTTAKELLEAGLIGDVITFRTAFGHGGPETWSITPGKGTWFFDKKRAAMGAMADLGIHKTDLIRYLLGKDVVRTTARLTTLDKRGPDDELISVDDNAICIYEMESGILGTMTVSWTYYGAEDNSTVLYGKKGIMRIYDDPAHSMVFSFSASAVTSIRPLSAKSSRIIGSLCFIFILRSV